MRRIALVALTPLLLLAACSTPADQSVPGGPDRVALNVRYEGGFVSQEMALGRGPIYTVTTDGRLLSEAAVPAIYPGPLVPSYFETRLTGADMTEIYRLVGEIGLPEMVDERDNSAEGSIADAPDDVITYWDQNGTHQYSVTALWFDHGRLPPATLAFRELRELLDNLSGREPSSVYEPERVRVLVGPGQSNPEFTDVREWPLPDTDLTGWKEVNPDWHCKVFDPSILVHFTDATQETTWNWTDDEPVKLLVRPLHPGEDDCP